MHLVLIGRTGSGKTTVAQLIEERLSIPHISSGDLARELVEEDEAAALALKQGMYAPEEAMRSLIRKTLESTDALKGAWLLEGFPRTMAQLVCLMQWTISPPVFLYLECEPFLCISRLTSRGRNDDNPDSIARKLEDFHKNTQPVIDALEGAGFLHTVDTGQLPPSSVVDYVENLLELNKRSS